MLSAVVMCMGRYRVQLVRCCALTETALFLVRGARYGCRVRLWCAWCGIGCGGYAGVHLLKLLSFAGCNVQVHSACVGCMVRWVRWCAPTETALFMVLGARCGCRVRV